jgi:hypothetical protein
MVVMMMVMKITTDRKLPGKEHGNTFCNDEKVLFCV